MSGFLPQSSGETSTCVGKTSSLEVCFFDNVRTVAVMYT